MADRIDILIAWAVADRQTVRPLSVPAGTTARQALRASELPNEFPEIDADRSPLGVYGHAVPDDYVLRAGDRVEIYRPLHQDPREARRAVARAGETMVSSSRRGRPG